MLKEQSDNSVTNIYKNIYNLSTNVNLKFRFPFKYIIVLFHLNGFSFEFVFLVHVYIFLNLWGYVNQIFIYFRIAIKMLMNVKHKWKPMLRKIAAY